MRLYRADSSWSCQVESGSASSQEERIEVPGLAGAGESVQRG